MIRQHRLTTLWAMALAFFVSQCGGATSFGGGAGSGAASTDEVIGGSINELTATASGMEIEFEDIDENEEVIFLFYSFNENNTAEGFQLAGDLSDTAALIDSANVFAALADEAVAAPLEIEGSADLTEEFHDLLRGLEENIPDDASVAQAPAAGELRFVTSGSQKTFHVLNSFSNSSSFETVTATLRYENESFEFYVDDRDAAALSDDDLNQLAEDFAAELPREREFFGTESDVNGDGKFAVLFTQVVNKLGGSAGGIVTGFFYAIDLFDNAQYANSNEMEVYYTFVPDPSGQYGSTVSKNFAMTNILPGVLPHEFQHMINFNQHYFVSGGSSEIGWLNEGLSHLAEDLYSIDSDDYMAASGLENPARVASYLGSISNVCFTCGTSLSQRGGSYLFLRYMYEQAEKGFLPNAASGKAVIQNLLGTHLRGIDNIVAAAFGVDGADSDFKDLFAYFSLAVYLSNTGLSDNERLNFDGINLRSIQDDNRGTVLSGPAIQTVLSLPFTDTLTGNSITYIKLSGSDIQEAGGKIEFAADGAADFGGFVIRE